MKNCIHSVIILGTLLLSSCQKNIEGFSIVDKNSVEIGVQVNDITKTSINGYQISFNPNETMTLVCEGKSTIPVANNANNTNVFKGIMPIKQNEPEICKWYSLYPSAISSKEQDSYSCILPSEQIAPFDESCNFMHSIKIDELYDEQGMPQSLPLEMHQLLGLIKISIVNSGEEYVSEYLKEVSISSPTSILAGNFTFSVPDDGIANPLFLGTEHSVRATYTSDVTVGKDLIHDVYLFVNPTLISNATIKVITDKHIFKYTSSNSFEAVQGGLTTMQTWDLNSSFSVSDRKIIACWGNSYTSRNGASNRTEYNEANYPDQLQELLGLDWYVYNGGYNGATLNVVVKHEKEWELTNDADVSVFYMERNEFPFNVSDLVFDYNDIKTRYIDAIQALTNKDDYIVCATHNRQFWKDAEPVIVGPTETQDYRFDKNGKTYDDEFLAPFIEQGRCVDLYHQIISDWKNWLLRVGVYSSVDDIDLEYEFPGQSANSNGAIIVDKDNDEVPETALDWPQSFWYRNSDHERRYVHPSKYGAKAMAILIYEKMQELGYLN